MSRNYSAVVDVVLSTSILLLLSCTTCHAHFSELDNPIQLLRSRSVVPGLRDDNWCRASPVVIQDDFDCQSWRLAVESNNLPNWNCVPEFCVNHVGDYMQKRLARSLREGDDPMQGTQYDKDCNALADAAIAYAKSIKHPCENDVWIFDIDETTLSNLPYYARDDVQFGSVPYVREKFQNWIREGKSPAVPAILRLYNAVLELKFKIVILTGVPESLLEVRSKNLKEKGYHNWEKLVFKKKSESGVSSVIYKSKKRRELVNEGYKIVANVGDQWSDLLGTDVGDRSFKVPNPMYYTS